MMHACMHAKHCSLLLLAWLQPMQVGHCHLWRLDATTLLDPEFPLCAGDAAYLVGEMLPSAAHGCLQGAGGRGSLAHCLPICSAAQQLEFYKMTSPGVVEVAQAVTGLYFMAAANSSAFPTVSILQNFAFFDPALNVQPNQGPPSNQGTFIDCAWSWAPQTLQF